MDMRYHNTDGYLHVSKIPYETKLADAFIKGSMERGFNYTDYNAATQVLFHVEEYSMLLQFKKLEENFYFS